MRRTLRDGWRVLVLALAAAHAGCAEEISAPRHVLLVVVDTLRARHLSAYGYERPTSPHVDRLAEGGVLFENATAQCSWTAPSMVSMFTGRHVLEERLSVPEEVPTLPELFARAGWRTGAFVVNPILTNPENGFRRGFDRFDAEAEFQVVADWIARSADRPTLTWVHWVDPHDPYGPAEEYAHFAKQGGALSDELEAYYDRAERELGLEDLDASRRRVASSIDGYDDDIRLVDSKIDILLRALDGAGLLEDSVVALASDHGEGLWTHANYPVAEREPGPLTLESTHKMTHGNHLYEEQVHVPLVLWGKGLPAGRRVADPVENVDLLPTLLELCDVPVPAGVTGRSLLPLIEEREGRDAAVSATRWVRSIRTAEGWKLIRPTAAGREAGLADELYFLPRDPFERENLAGEEPERVATLAAELDRRLADGLVSDGEGELSEANEQALRDLGYIE